jgi:hypothetical protein
MHWWFEMEGGGGWINKHSTINESRNAVYVYYLMGARGDLRVMRNIPAQKAKRPRPCL